MAAVMWNPALTEKRTECNCAPCRSFWKKAFHEGGERIAQLSCERAGTTAILSSQNGLLRRGDRVRVHVSGLETNADTEKSHLVYSTHNGVYKGKRYFYCPRGHGAMVRYSDLTPLSAISKTPPVTGNQMFPSFEEVKKRRKLREQKIKNAEEKLRKDHEMKRRAQMERFSKSAPHPRISPRPTKASKMRMEKSDDQPKARAQDEDDIAYRDYIARDRQRQSLYVDAATLEEQRFRKLKKAFGGDEKAERMAETLRKLEKGYEEGRIIAMAERE